MTQYPTSHSDCCSSCLWGSSGARAQSHLGPCLFPSTCSNSQLWLSIHDCGASLLGPYESSYVFYPKSHLQKCSLIFLIPKVPHFEFSESPFRVFFSQFLQPTYLFPSDIHTIPDEFPILRGADCLGRAGRSCQKACRYSIAGEVEKIQAKIWW